MKTSAIAASLLAASAAAGPAPAKRASLPTVSVKGNGMFVLIIQRAACRR